MASSASLLGVITLTVTLILFNSVIPRRSEIPYRHPRLAASRYSGIPPLNLARDKTG